MSDDTKPVVGLVTIGPGMELPRERGQWLPDAPLQVEGGNKPVRISVSTPNTGEPIRDVAEKLKITHVRPKSGRPTGRKPRDEDRKMEAKIAIDAIEAALEEFELACVSAALTARQRACFVEHVSKLELAKRAVRK